jgi:enediyne biosynthesis protein E8
VVATPEFLDDVQLMTLEAFADTIVPGSKRFPVDPAIAGVCDEPGAVEAGALQVLTDPATGVTAGLAPLSAALNRHAGEHAERVGLSLDTGVPPFVALDYDHRAALVVELTAPGHPERDGWVLLALFSNMAYDTAPHRHTVEALADGHPGLIAMGFAKPDADGLWRFPDFSYGRRALAKRHPNTTESGSPE